MLHHHSFEPNTENATHFLIQPHNCNFTETYDCYEHNSLLNLQMISFTRLWPVKMSACCPNSLVHLPVFPVLCLRPVSLDWLSAFRNFDYFVDLHPIRMLGWLHRTLKFWNHFQLSPVFHEVPFISQCNQFLFWGFHFNKTIIILKYLRVVTEVTEVTGLTCFDIEETKCIRWLYWYTWSKILRNSINLKNGQSKFSFCILRLPLVPNYQCFSDCGTMMELDL